MQFHQNFLENILKKNGPDIEDYYDLDAWIAEVAEQARKGKLTLDDLTRLREMMGEAISVETMQGFIFQKPHGYAGDYEIIDRIYTRYVSANPHVSKWDRYMQEHTAVHAVRNRVDYFCQQLYKRLDGNQAADARMEILNLASGPGRDMLQFFEKNPEAQVHIDCIDADQNAVNHARNLCINFLDKITFHVRNALRFRSTRKYNLIWSAGLFDYFEDRVFVRMLKHLGTMVAGGGEIVIGNFSTKNPSRPYMELLEWHLHHRSPSRLMGLAIEGGFSAEQIRIQKEPTGVNLFLHIQVNDKQVKE